ncbi:hypothetical protein Q6U66_000629 [Vibrio vulnificus]|nr:hypothetical protein [Vibrio vulnificus]MCU8518552.1 hypothetical protein [Vibrio vulnificus]
MGNESAIKDSNIAIGGSRSAIDGSIFKDDAWGVFCMGVLKNIYSLH